MPIKFAVSILFGFSSFGTMSRNLLRGARSGALEHQNHVEWTGNSGAVPPGFNVGLKTLEDWKIGRRTFLSRSYRLSLLNGNMMGLIWLGSLELGRIFWVTMGTWWNKNHVEFPIDRGSSKINTTMG